MSKKRKKSVAELATQSCHSCGKQYAGVMKKNGRKWLLKVDGESYDCTPYASTCTFCGIVNDFDVAKKRK